MVSLSGLIKKHRENVLMKEQKQTMRLQAKLKQESKRTAEATTFRSQLAKQKQEQSRAVELQRKLKSIRNKPRDEKIRRLNAIGKRAGAGFLSGIRSVAKEIERQQKKQCTNEKRRITRAKNKKKKTTTRRRTRSKNKR